MHSSSEGSLSHPECRQTHAALITDYGWVLSLGPSVIVGIAFIFLRLFSKSNSPVIWITFLVAWPLGIALAFAIYWLGRHVPPDKPEFIDEARSLYREADELGAIRKPILVPFYPKTLTG